MSQFRHPIPNNRPTSRSILPPTHPLHPLGGTHLDPPAPIRKSPPIGHEPFLSTDRRRRPQINPLEPLGGHHRRPTNLHDGSGRTSDRTDRRPRRRGKSAREYRRYGGDGDPCCVCGRARVRSGLLYEPAGHPESHGACVRMLVCSRDFFADLPPDRTYMTPSCRTLP